MRCHHLSKRQRATITMDIMDWNLNQSCWNALNDTFMTSTPCGCVNYGSCSFGTRTKVLWDCYNPEWLFFMKWAMWVIDHAMGRTQIWQNFFPPYLESIILAFWKLNIVFFYWQNQWKKKSTWSIYHIHCQPSNVDHTAAPSLLSYALTESTILAVTPHFLARWSVLDVSRLW